MKIRIFFVIVLLFVCIIPVSTAKADSPKTYFSGEICTDSPEGTGGEFGWHGRTTYIRDYHVFYNFDTNDERMNGASEVTVNIQWNYINGTGPVWGTTQIVNAEGSWDGLYNGLNDNDVYNLHAVLHGSGAYEGLVVTYDLYRPGLQLCMDIEGYIVETGNY